MSYVPIYNKLHELETRVSTLENAPAAPAAAPVLVSLSPDTEPVDVSGFATKAELPDVSSFATKADIPDLSAYATKADIPDLSAYATKAELPDLSVYATKAELPDVSSFAAFATKDELADLYTKFENAINVITQLNTKINEANEKIAALETSKEAA